MTSFWIVAVLLVLAMVAALLAPVMRRKSGPPRYLTAAVTALGVPALALGMYFSIGDWRTPEPAAAAESQELSVIVQQLEERLQRQGGTLEEWVMLGKSYIVMGRFGDAAAAYGQARGLAGDDNLDVLASYAEALVLSDQSQLLGTGGQAFERILVQRPSDIRGLWYGGLAAFEKADYDLAITRWRQVLEQSPPETFRPIIEERISEAVQRLGAGITLPAEAQAAEASKPGERGVASQAPATSGGTPAAAGASSVIRVSVSADPGLISSVAPNTPIFVLARSSTPGPPLAARRMSVGDLPFTVELSDSDAMVAGRNISSSDRVEIVARVALGGTPVAQPGDLFGEQALDLSGTMPPVQIRISKRVE